MRIPVPENQLSKDNLAIAFIDDDGEIELYETKRVVIDGVDYLEFETEHFSMYAVVQRDVIPLADDELTKTGEQKASAGLLFVMIAGGACLLLRRRYHNRVQEN